MFQLSEFDDRLAHLIVDPTVAKETQFPCVSQTPDDGDPVPEGLCEIKVEAFGSHRDCQPSCACAAKCSLEFSIRLLMDPSGPFGMYTV